MSKKLQGENTKAALARARKAEAEAAAEARKKQELEDAQWEESDKKVLKKVHRKDVKQKRRMEALERKMESRRLLDEETTTIQGNQTTNAATGSNDTQAQTVEKVHVEQQKLEEEPKPKGLSFPLFVPYTDINNLEIPLEENVNRVGLEEDTEEDETIEEAMAVLSTGEDLDRHPERRMRAAFATFGDTNMPRLKMEFPNMRLAQLKQQLKKEWLKSPDNPLNQRFASYNSK